MFLRPIFTFLFILSFVFVLFIKHEYEHDTSTNRHDTIRTVPGPGVAKLTNGLAWHGTKTDGLCQARHEINGLEACPCRPKHDPAPMYTCDYTDIIY
ncbi:unnamed protein product [Linum trigynum]|uniref:Uncharacterized protein n=1 Tax=Linum trigynum TaxID=586398 RepID=A0AAV2G7I1_9ROSI